ncbi:MAG: hypothetical protein ACI8UZ_001265 [Akkermansiaceae bacterium]|jgi:hypothetical protein
MKNSLEEIAETVPIAELRQDIAGLREGPLAQQGPFDVYLEPAQAIPHVLLEIGRLRELTFRSVGAGVGKARDLDDLEEHYSHLFLWDREKHRLAGGYRIARTDLVFAEHGFKGLYTGSLCEFDKPLLDYLNPALELGRSWVHPEYQRSLHPLLGLWKGIGHFVARYPRYHKLFGVVTISDDYTSISQDIIVRFLRRTKIDDKWSAAMRAFLPFKDHPEDLSAGLSSIEEVSARVSTYESDGKGVPVLLRQYLKLNATLLGFAYDPKFGDCLDAMVLVDLREAPQNILKKYMGKEGHARFAAHVAGE